MYAPMGGAVSWQSSGCGAIQFLLYLGLLSLVFIPPSLPVPETVGPYLGEL